MDSNSLTVSSVQDLLSMPQAKLDELYKLSEPGEIPVGDTEGTVLIWTGSLFGKIATPLIKLFLWQGKVFNSAQGDLLNKISLFGIKSIRAKVSVDESWLVKGEKTIVLDYSKTSFVAQMIRDEIRQVAPGLYLGKVFLWGKHVLDFSLSLKNF